MHLETETAKPKNLGPILQLLRDTRPVVRDGSLHSPSRRLSKRMPERTGCWHPFVIDYAGLYYHRLARQNIDARGHIGNVFASDRNKASGSSALHRSTAGTEENGEEESTDDDEQANETNASNV